MDQTIIETLIEEALKARKKAYTPYSHFQVGAALLSEDQKIYTGCNIENAAYSPSVCAERTALFKAVTEGNRTFTAIAIVGGAEGRDPDEMLPPCGVCRQVIREFCNPETFEIILAISGKRYRSYKLKELLPFSFGPENLE